MGHESNITESLFRAEAAENSSFAIAGVSLSAEACPMESPLARWFEGSVDVEQKGLYGVMGRVVLRRGRRRAAGGARRSLGSWRRAVL